MRLIDIDAFRKEHSMNVKCEGCPMLDKTDDICSGRDCYTITDLCRWLDNAPIVYAEPLRHGRWIENKTEYSRAVICSECGESALHEVHSYGGVYSGGNEIKLFKSNYCPHCGAKMDKED